MREEEFECIKIIKTEPEYYRKWEGIRNVYKPILDEGAYRSDIKYMTHNYTNHCVNIYTNIDMLMEWQGISKPTIREMFLLDVAVILHDICMAFLNKKRSVHSREAYKYILEEISSNKRNIINSYLLPDEAEQVADIVLGHSDLKYKGRKEDTIDYLLKKHEEDFEYEKVRVCHLAAILRLADELDATRNRITRPFDEMKFDLQDEKDWQSSKHYRKLQLVKKITPNTRKNDELLIHINEDILGLEDNEDVDLLVEVREKIQAELNNINKVYVKYPQNLCPYKRFLSINIKCVNENIAQEINETDLRLKKKTTNYSVPDVELAKEITKAVLDNELLISGHYNVNGEICSRDWIDTIHMLEDNEIFRKIISFFEKKIFSEIKERKVIVLGIGDVGLRLGSILAFKFNFPFLNIVPQYIEQYYDEHETNIIELERDSKYLLVTDVVVTGKSLVEVCKKYEVDLSDVLGIYTIFLRNCNLNLNRINGVETSKITAINNEFDAELKEKKECNLWIRHKRCICNNKIIV